MVSVSVCVMLSWFCLRINEYLANKINLKLPGGFGCCGFYGGGSVVVYALFIATPIVCSSILLFLPLLCYVVLNFLSSFAIILLKKSAYLVCLNCLPDGMLLDGPP